eukprot:1154630-Pelagomonas_calceolata.AAC.2
MSNKHHATGQLAAGLFPQDDGSLPPIVERIDFWRMGAKKDFPVLAGVAVRLLCMHSTYTLLHVPVSATGQVGALAVHQAPLSPGSGARQEAHLCATASSPVSGG